ncbi:MAG: hypothetical protein ACOCWG_01455 [bacterium]
MMSNIEYYNLKKWIKKIILRNETVLDGIQDSIDHTNNYEENKHWIIEEVRRRDCEHLLDLKDSPIQQQIEEHHNTLIKLNSEINKFQKELFYLKTNCYYRKDMINYYKKGLDKLLAIRKKFYNNEPLDSILTSDIFFSTYKKNQKKNLN